jgi:hypothetical protein
MNSGNNVRLFKGKFDQSLEEEKREKKRKLVYPFCLIFCSFYQIDQSNLTAY